ncbi:MAG: DNA-directed RNA polymerase subunit omega [Eubacteriales bacterium]|nr:DNA-directed RNA polymerase subunit omega [Eubacteriales bacterium]
MLHPSYAELIKVVNNETEGDTPVVNSRYSIVLATAKRARQIINGRKPMSMPSVDKPLSIAVDELNKGLLKIQPEEEVSDLEVSEMPEEIKSQSVDGAQADVDDTAQEQTAEE